MLESIQIKADKPAESTPATAATIVETPTGVQVTPPADSTGSPERPAWLPEKFVNAEALAQAYKELETKLGSKTTETPAPAAPPPTAQTTAETAKRAGLDLAALSAEFVKDGKLSDDSMAKLAAAGITVEQVSAYTEGQKALAQQLVNEVAQVAGGAEQLKSVLEWARVNLSKDEAAAYDAAVDSGNVQLVKLAMQTVVSKYSAATGTSPKLVTAEPAPSTTEKPYASNAEIIAAMSDKRYQTDPAYRKSVERRLAVSTSFGA